MPRWLYNLVYYTTYYYMCIFHSYRVYGKAQDVEGGVIFASNHASNYDPIAVAGVSFPHPLHYMAKESLFDIPLFGGLIRSFGAYPVSLNQADLGSIRRTCDLLKRGKKILIFPEGLRTWDGTMNPIKRGIGLVAEHAHATIIPVYIHGNYEAWNRLSHFPRWFRPIHCVVGSPILWEQFEGLPRKEARQRICDALEKSIHDLKDWYEAGCQGTPP